MYRYKLKNPTPLGVWSCQLTLFSAIYLVLSLLIFMRIPTANAHLDNDSLGYEKQALTFCNHEEQVEIPFHTNGYPFFLALIYKLFGYSRTITIIIQMLLGLGIGFLIYSMATMLFSPIIALVSFFLFSINPGFLIFPQFILSEILLVFFLTFACERLIRYVTSGLNPPVDQSLTAIIASGLLFGLSIAVKPVALYYPILLLPILFVFMPQKPLVKLKAIALFALAFCIPIAGYAASNKALYGKYCISPLSNANLYLWFQAKIKAKQNHTTHDEELTHLFPLIGDNMLEAKSWEKLKESFVTLVASNPILAVSIWIKEVFKSFAGLFVTNLKVLLEPDVKGGDLSFFKSQESSLLKKMHTYITGGTESIGIKIVGYLEVLFNLLRYLLILIALAFLAMRKRWFLLFFFVSYIFYFSMITGHDGCARYRLMFESMFILLSAEGIGWLATTKVIQYHGGKEEKLCKNMNIPL